MKTLLLVIGLLILSGCSSNEDAIQNEEKKKETAAETAEMKAERSDETLEELLEEVDFGTQLTQSCGGLAVEMTTAYLHADDVRPSIIGFCHHAGNANLEGNTAAVAAAIYNESDKTWHIDINEHEFLTHPARFAGNLQLKDGSERVVIELYEDPAAFGGTGAIILSSKDNGLVIERINSSVTQNGKVSTDGNKILIEDDHVIETFTYGKNSVTHTETVKETDTKADRVITYNKHNNGPLFATPENGSVLDVKPGDIISFVPDKPLNLVDFQIRTGMKADPDQPDTYIVSESDIGDTIELGEYPYDDMIMYTIGDASFFASTAFFNELKEEKMPGSSVQLSTPNTEIESLLEGETFIHEYSDAGAKHLEYEKFIYAVPFLEEEGDIIYTIIRKLPFSTPLTGDDFIESWGEPDERIIDPEFSHGNLTLHYSFPAGHYAEVHLSDTMSNSEARAISLHRKK
ncbi:hypothetical protein BTO30_01515 [Domibacillus antri]|uniref:Uncharacterized protein n=1 Tax=Domibacillus antri TaxID=1714264 RepID=A0A1Q8Q9V2_9BACI|nr:hypothetical protein [Domibacillus antri]OLN24119.1 hypothetical protein BTO30_01515 [Domibacillus antri]